MDLYSESYISLSGILWIFSNDQDLEEKAIIQYSDEFWEEIWKVNTINFDIFTA